MGGDGATHDTVMAFPAATSETDVIVGLNRDSNDATFVLSDDSMVDVDPVLDDTCNAFTNACHSKR
jgi:hypothetical protein